MNKIKLHSYQKNIPLNKKGLFWKMGLGKTLASLYFASKKAKNILIVCPKSLINQWSDEINFFKQNFDHNENNYTVINIESLMKYTTESLNLLVENPFFVIVDESHLLFKTYNTKRTKWFIKYISKKCKDNILLLSGTPIKKNEVDLFAQHLVANHYFKDSSGNFILTQKDFIREFMLTKEIKLSNGRKFVDIIGLNPTKEDLFYSQFDEFWDFKTTDSYVYNHEKVLIEPTEDFILMQDGIREGILCIDEVESPLAQLTQAVSKYDQIADGFIYDEEKSYEIVNTIKIDALNNLLIKLIESPPKAIKILIFCRFIASRNIVFKCLSQHESKYNVFLYEKDYNIIESFKNKKTGVSILISSQKLMSTGFNLQDANIVIFYSNDGDFATKSQAIARVARQGQQKDVYIYDLVINSSLREEIIEKSTSFSKSKCSADERALQRSLKKEIKLKKLENYLK